jgi:DNA-binding CsgD family transcriptional regulator
MQSTDASISGDVDNNTAAAMADALDCLRAGVFLVDRLGYIVHANAAGRLFLDAGDVVYSGAGKLTVHNVRMQGAMRKSLRRGTTGHVRAEDFPFSLISADGTPYLLWTYLFDAQPCRGSGQAIAAVFVTEAKLHAPKSSHLIAQVYALTPAEFRILMAIFDHGGVREVAALLGIAESTVKTHLSHLFEKANTNRQADLVRCVAAFWTPLLP